MDPVKLYAAVLYPDIELREQAIVALQTRFGEIDITGSPVPFDHTDYYAAELGAGLVRVLVSFAALAHPSAVVDAKLAARGLEQRFAVQGRRRVNLDLGYLDAFKVTLASFKGRGNKVYLDRDVWLDLQLYFEKGRLHPLPWTFPDFRVGKYDADLLRIRARYREQLKARPFPVS